MSNDNIIKTEVDENTTIITSDERSRELLENALSTYDPGNKIFSRYLNFTGTNFLEDVTLKDIEYLGQNPQTNLEKTKKINEIIRKQINIDDLVGMVVQSIDNNINTNYKLSWKDFDGQRNKLKMLARARKIIEDFNYQINIEQLIVDSIELTYCEGTYICVLRNNDRNWVIDYYPLGVAEISGYSQNGQPVVLVNIPELKNALRDVMIKTKKGKSLFFDDVETEIKNSYPKEVYEAYKAKERYAKLDVAYTGVIRINNRGRKYGLSPIFRSLPAVIMLKRFQAADAADAKSKEKKIIHQKLRKEVMGTDYSKKGLEEMAFAHQQLCASWKNNVVLYSSPPAVESILYVEPKTTEIDKDKIYLYRNKVLSSLGVAFLTNDGSQTASTANISLQQLLQCINKISEQVERMIENFYRTVLKENNIPDEYIPKISIIDSEMLEMNLRMELSKLLYATFGCSRETTLGMLDIDLADEKAKRMKENEDNLDEVFMPYGTSYTTSGDDGDAGRPKEDPKEVKDLDKQDYDQNYERT